MGFATRCAAGELVTTPTPTSTPARRPRPSEFDAFAAPLRRDLAPVSRLEEVLADRVILAAWRLHLASIDEFDAARNGEGLPLPSRAALRTERSLETTLELLETARAARWGRSPGVIEPLGSNPADDLDLGEADFSNEWTSLPGDLPSAIDDEEDVEADQAGEAVVSPRWQDRLVFDFNVSESSPVVKGTWVTVSHVVSLIVDGWTWSDILRTHPELTEDDIRTCLAYTIEQDNNGEV
jgi:uncharacterized protein (DUF433 family)